MCSFDFLWKLSLVISGFLSTGHYYDISPRKEAYDEEEKD